MSFKLPRECRSYFSRFIGSGTKGKLETLFDEYYICLMLGFARGRTDEEPDLEPSEFYRSFPADYKESGYFVSALLIATEVIYNEVNVSDEGELENLITKIIDPQAESKLSDYGIDLLNIYASVGMDIIKSEMLEHINLEEFYQEYFEWFDRSELI